MPKISGYKGWRKVSQNVMSNAWEFVIFPNIYAGEAQISHVNGKFVAWIKVNVGDVRVNRTIGRFKTFGEALKALNKVRRQTSDRVFKRVN